MRNNVALRISDKRGSKRPKKPENSPFMLGIAEHSDLRGGSMSPRLFLQQNTAKPNSILSLQIAVFCVLWLGWRTWSLSFFNRHTGLSWGLHVDIYGRRKEGSGVAHFHLKICLPPRNSPDECLYFLRTFSFHHPDSIGRDDFTDPPKVEGGYADKPLYDRRCRAMWEEAEVVYHPDSFSCLIFDRRKLGCRDNADSLYILLFCW